MLGRSHLVIGAAGVALAAAQSHLIQPHAVLGVNVSAGAMLAGAGLPAGMLGALLPDIDHAGSTATHSFWGRGCLNATLGRLFRAVLGGHRGLTHSLAAIVIVAGVCGCQPWWPGLFPAWSDIGTAFTLGYVSHILADMLTKEGVRLWTPLTRREVGLLPRFLRFETGSLTEFLIVGAIVLAAAASWLKQWI